MIAEINPTNTYGNHAVWKVLRRDFSRFAHTDGSLSLMSPR